MQPPTNHGTWNPHRLAPPALLLAIALLAALPSLAAPPMPLSSYAYDDTRRLVRLVDRAAALIERTGPAAFRGDLGTLSRWPDDDFYVFAYTLDGTCQFHGGDPTLVGRNLLDMRDLDGKPVIRLVVDIGAQPEPNAADWIFYRWEDGRRLQANWKAAYVRKAIGPDGQVYVVGSGSYGMKMERHIVRANVTRAADSILAKGRAAFAELLNPASRYTLPDAYVFVMDTRGVTLVDPAYPTLLGGRDLLQFEDAVGVPVVKIMLERIATRDEVWLQFLMPVPGGHALARKALYVRKIVLDGQVLVVGSEFFLPTPIWMRV